MTISDFTRKQSNSADLAAHRKQLWAIMLAGLTIGFLGMHVMAVRPMREQILALQQEVANVHSDMESLVGSRENVWKTNDLLSGLRQEREQLDQAQATLTQIRQIRAGIQDEFERTNKLLTGLRGRLIEQERSAKQADAALNRLTGLKYTILQETDDLDTAIGATDQLLKLKDQIVIRGGSTSAAINNASRLMSLRDGLSGTNMDLETAGRNLERLLEMNSKLSRNSIDAVSAIETLEFLGEFQKELQQQVRSMQGLRRDLMEIALMESTVVRALRMLEPLAQLGDLRRVGEDEVREAARVIQERRNTRLSESGPQTPLSPIRSAAAPRGFDSYGPAAKHVVPLPIESE